MTTETVYDNQDFDSSNYSKYRPVYPTTLFDYIYGVHEKGAGKYDVAVDIATGTGITAIALADKFSKVIATDSSASMLKSATQHPKISYQQSKAESMAGIADESVDLITVSTAAHWFDMPLFYKECKRILKPSGTLAIWAYGSIHSDDFAEELDPLFLEYCTVTLKDYWDPRRTKLDRLYIDDEFVKTPFRDFKRVVFPFEDASVKMAKQMSAEDVRRYYTTWSAYKTFKDKCPDAPDVARVFSDKMRKIVGTDAPVRLYHSLVLLIMKK